MYETPMRLSKSAIYWFHGAELENSWLVQGKL